MRISSDNKFQQIRRVKTVALLGLLLTVICSVFGLIDGLRSYVGSYHNGIFYAPFADAVRWDVSGWMIWVGFIPVIIWLCRRVPISQNNWRKIFTVFVPVGLAMALARTFFPIAVHIPLFGGVGDLRQWLPGKSFILASDFVIAFSFYLLVLAFGQAVNYYKRLREEELRTSQLELQLSKAQLHALKAQLQPHFLFNTLNSISALQLENTEAAQEMTARLGDFLRLTLENVGSQEVTLEREIEFLQCYLDIEKVRFGSRLSTSIEIEPQVLGCQVPNLLLQPIVENSLKHGIGPKTSTGQIHIRAVRQNGWLKVEVHDNGEGVSDSELAGIFSSGLGLSNTKARLEQLYGSNFKFQLRNAETGGLVTTLCLPHTSNGNSFDEKK
jgi:two-component system, LytTR family, sensor kinase